MKHSLSKPGRIARYGGASAAAVAIALIGGPAVLAQDEPADPATITMEFAGKRIFFDGPATIAKGDELRILNNTSVRKVGPHTFSLAKLGVLPDTPKEFRECFSPGKVCMDIATAHKFNPKTEKIAKPVVDVGVKGWNRSFTKERNGDSWYTETKGESTTRRVTASAGTTLRFICAIHPDMQGKIKVVAAE
jgi:hypothetical protein